MTTIAAIQKRCLIGSTVAHGFILLVVMFGAALFVSRKPLADLPRLKVIPTRFVDGLSGGGGNPNVPITSEQKKGDPNAQPQPAQPKPQPPAPKPPVQKPEVKKAEPKPVEQVKPAMPKDPINLKPVTRKNPSKTDVARADKSTAKANDSRQREARERADRLNKEIAKTIEGIGFQQGTQIDVNGPGGEAYADYSQFVKQIYDDAWVVMQDLSTEDGVARIKVTIMRDGRVANAAITQRSGNRALDQSVQRAIEKVTRLPAFPEGTKDLQRTFTIEFSLKARRGTA